MRSSFRSCSREDEGDIAAEEVRGGVTTFREDLSWKGSTPAGALTGTGVRLGSACRLGEGSGEGREAKRYS